MKKAISILMAVLAMMPVLSSAYHKEDFNDIVFYDGVTSRATARDATDKYIVGKKITGRRWYCDDTDYIYGGLIECINPVYLYEIELNGIEARQGYDWNPERTRNPYNPYWQVKSGIMVRHRN